MLGRIRKLFARLTTKQEPLFDTPFGGHYEDWRNKRIKAIIDHYSTSFFLNKHILEVGCGYGDIGAALLKRGATVTCSDARTEHLDVVKQRHPQIEVLMLDMDAPMAMYRKWDLLVHMGLLYHLREPERALVDACSLADHLILETEVCDSDDPFFVLRLDEFKDTGITNNYDQAFNKIGGRPSTAFVERVLQSCGMTVTRHFSSNVNSSIHVYDWKPLNDGSWRHGLRRMWFAERKPPG